MDSHSLKQMLASLGQSKLLQQDNRGSLAGRISIFVVLSLLASISAVAQYISNVPEVGAEAQQRGRGILGLLRWRQRSGGAAFAAAPTPQRSCGLYCCRFRIEISEHRSIPVVWEVFVFLPGRLEGVASVSGATNP